MKIILKFGSSKTIEMDQASLDELKASRKAYLLSCFGFMPLAVLPIFITSEQLGKMSFFSLLVLSPMMLFCLMMAFRVHRTLCRKRSSGA